MKPYRSFQIPDPLDQRRGEELVAQGKIGCLILAGGQGTRLGAGPKGLVGVTPVKHKTLFQVFLERVKVLSDRFEQPLQIGIMTSPLNHDESVFYLEKSKWFGLQAEQVSLFKQGVLPLLDEDGHALSISGPDGNGRAISHLCASGIWDKWRSCGIEWVQVIVIDNPLADPFDFLLAGFQEKKGADLVVKAIRKEDPQEQVGLLVEIGGKLAVIEYSEIAPEKATERDASGKLLYDLAHIGLFGLAAPFIERVKNVDLPYHSAHKTIMGKSVIKNETFLFDLIPYADHPEVLLYPRNATYAPLKNASGDRSLKTVQAALIARDRELYRALTGLEPPQRLFELSPSFLYPTPSLRKKWLGRPLPDTDYIEG